MRVAAPFSLALPGKGDVASGVAGPGSPPQGGLWGAAACHLAACFSHFPRAGSQGLATPPPEAAALCAQSLSGWVLRSPQTYPRTGPGHLLVLVLGVPPPHPQIALWSKLRVTVS